MKFLRVGPAGQEKPAVLASDGTIRDISSLVNDICPKSIASGVLSELDDVSVLKYPQLADNERIGPCIRRTGNFIAVGLNYIQHAIETDAPIPEEPILFNKASSCISGPHDPVVLPRGSEKSDWEVELAMVIGRPTSYVIESEALDHVFGYMVCNDVSERAFQLERGGQWMKGKCCPTFGPIGPLLVTAEEVGDPQTLILWLDLNGERMQESNTDDMIFSVARIVSYTSQFMALEPGDIITTGTPQGVGLGMSPNRFLKQGDVMELGIEGLGSQRQTVMGFDPEIA
jgi:2-keto-4-pentenoate hydratase/2-oxohepta-3-ene-1,7-dioic acid hydratase in catechol pathway